ncbi:MAG: AarF/ABC1/UbiB kinase family protein [Bdellovibrionaceae bacterium]|nr:AarF/ABC1/UbiB kinase family protein [Bdellovibrio sp.]
MPSKRKELKSIKSSLLSRSFSVAKLGLGAGLKYAGSKVRNTPLDEFINSQAIHFTKELGELKGSLMKAGQMLSMYGEYFFPPQANKILKSLQSESPPIEWPTMKKYLAKYLKPELLAELEVDPESIGAASMGQVHKARIKKTGEWIALKIQYPDVDKAIDSDILALKSLLKFSRVIPSSIDLTAVFEEIKTMLRQELDYHNEARLTTMYGERIKGDKRFVVPKVYDRYSNKKLLATEYIEGVRVDHPLVQSLSQKRRNHLAENYLDIYFKEIFDWNLVQTDPHLGNYKIQIDPFGEDRIVLLDFGACREFSTDFMKDYRRMIKGSILRDQKLFFSGAEKLGFIIKSDPPEYIKAFEEFCYETVEPFKPEGTYQWKQSDLPGRVVKKAIQFKNFDLRSPPREILFLDRKTSGVFIFMSVLKADLNARKIIDPYLAQV